MDSELHTNLSLFDKINLKIVQLQQLYRQQEPKRKRTAPLSKKLRPSFYLLTSLNGLKRAPWAVQELRAIVPHNQNMIESGPRPLFSGVAGLRWPPRALRLTGQA